MPNEPCPIEEGDRVDHKLFGFGTVSGAPVAQVRASKDLRGIEDAGWIVPVVWDDATRTAGKVAHVALRKVSSPDSRPFTYWDRQWQPLLAKWLSTRRKVEEAAKAFRPAPDQAALRKLQLEEAAAWEAMEQFRRDEDSGLHP